MKSASESPVVRRPRAWAPAVAGVSAMVVGASALMFFAATSSGAPRTAATTSAPYASSSNAYANNYYAKHAEAAKAAKLAYDAVYAKYLAGTATLEDVVKWSERLRDTSYASGNAAEDHRDRMLTVEAEVKKRVAAGNATSVDQNEIAYYRAMAESSAP